MRVLLIEDNQNYAAFIEDLFKKSMNETYQVTLVGNLKEGLDLLETNKFDVILADLGLPDSEGINTFNALHKFNPHIPIVVLTGLSDENIAVQALQAGAQDYLIKGTFDNKFLLLALRYAIERQKITEIEATRNAAIEASKLKSQFLANMSHELRTPMYGIIGMIELLKEQPLDESTKEYTETIHSSATSLLKILDDILDLSMIESGRLVIEKVTLDLRILIEDLIKSFHSELLKKSISIDTHIQDNVPTLLVADPFRLRQVLTNLIANALKFTQRGSIHINVTKTDESERHIFLRIAIQDTGIGISDEDQKHLFQVFSQIDPSVKRKYSGAGLGLVISKQLVEAMGGRIFVKSIPNIGSTFWFEIPFEKYTKSKIAKPIEQNFQKPLKSSSNALQPLKVLVGEDNSINQKVIKKQLEKFGINAEIVSNGIEILKCLENNNYDMIFMDCQMPEMDGYTASSEIRKKEKKGSHIPIIAITAHAMQGDREKCLAAGMDDYISKPVKSADLASIIEKYTYRKINKTNLEHLRDLVGNDEEAMNELLTLFKSHTQAQLKDFEEALAQQDMEQIIFISHNIVGSSSTCGFFNIEKIFREIESLAKSNHLKEVKEIYMKVKNDVRDTLKSS